MAYVQMTDKEKALLDLAYTDGKRILEGKLFDYQEKALSELRACREHLKNRYPNERFKIISFQPSSRKGCVEMQFIQPERGASEYVLKQENGIYIEKFMVRTDDTGKDYVYIQGEDGLLKKQYVKTGKTQWDYLEVKSGLSLTDKIAFPLASNVEEGAKTREVDSLYDDYY